MSVGEYTKLEWPDTPACRAICCACCGAAPEPWQFITEANKVQRVVMCSTSKLEDEETSELGIGNSSCPFFMPPADFYAGTLREAVAYWNKVNGLLVDMQAKNAE